MKIAITGASGLIGSALIPALRRDGHEVLRFVRRAAHAVDELPWDPSAHSLDPALLSDVDAVVHLAGAGVGDKRWTSRYKKVVLDSRRDGTTTIARAMAAAEPRPRVLLSASGIGYYGDTGSTVVDEGSPQGGGFLAEVCRVWEASTAPAEAAGIRVAHMRTAVVLARSGGALAKQLPIWRLGLGGKLGSGRQYLSWISLTDQIDAVRFLLEADVSGPVNLAGPEPVTNQEFGKALGRALGRPSVMWVPGPAMRIGLGEFASEGVLIGQRVAPRVLTEAGFQFSHRTLDEALKAELNDPVPAL
jgi:uncharacterized protein